jgi:ATP/maltotriose-dependent transcriptional regulator MalT
MPRRKSNWLPCPAEVDRQLRLARLHIDTTKSLLAKGKPDQAVVAVAAAGEHAKAAQVLDRYCRLRRADVEGVLDEAGSLAWKVMDANERKPWWAGQPLAGTRRRR